MSVDTSSTIPPRVMRAVQEQRRLETDDLQALARAHDVLTLGALADEVRRRHRGNDATFVRVHRLALADVDTWSAPPVAAQELRLVGEWPGTEGACVAIQRAKSTSGGRVIRGFSASRVWAAGGASMLQALADAGLDELAWVEVVPEAAAAVTAARAAGLAVRVVGLADPPADRTEWLMSVRALQDAVGGLDVVAPLAWAGDPSVPTTGFDDVRAVALARLALDGGVSIQVDWHRDGPKLAQVALTVGADDLDLVSAADDVARGPRRAPLEEVRRNIVAAGLVPVERDGRHRRLGA